MDEETKNRLENVEKILNDQKNEFHAYDQKLNKQKKQIDRSYNFPTYIIRALTVIILALGFFSAFSLQTEISRLNRIEDDLNTRTDKAENDLRNEIRAAFEKGKKPPNVIILSDIDNYLEGQTVVARITPPENKNYMFRVKIPVIFKNIGHGATDPLFAKIYLKKDVHTGITSSDEKEFAYEMYFQPEKWPFQPAILPAGVSTVFNIEFDVKNYDKKIEKYEALIKIYFGGDTHNQANFYFKIPSRN